MELTQIDTFYNGLNDNDQDSLKTDERIDKLADQISTLVEIVSKKVVTPALVKAVEEICVTCGGPHAWHNCPNTDNNQCGDGSDKQELPQRTSSILFQIDRVTRSMMGNIVSLQVMLKDEYVGKKCSSQEVSKIISRLKIKISSLKLQDIKLKIKIQNHKHGKGISKEFPSIKGSKIQDVTRSKAISAMTIP
ncbi:hypothetical protein Tco_0379259 [Tanacetum coccineum]